MRIVGAAVLLTLALVGSVSATVVTPDDFGGPFCLSPAFGAAACAIADQYKQGGLLFSQMGVGTAVFNDPPDAWLGINGGGVVDLLAPINGEIVALGTTTPGVTGFLSVEAGFAVPGALLLSVFDPNGVLLTSRVSGLDGTGPHGRTLITISRPGIAFFSVSTPGNDTFGVDQIEVGAIDGVAVVPEPGTLLLAGTALGGAALLRRRRRT